MDAKGNRQLPPEALRFREASLATLSDEAKAAVGGMLHACRPRNCYHHVVREIQGLSLTDSAPYKPAVKVKRERGPRDQLSAAPRPPDLDNVRPDGAD